MTSDWIFLRAVRAKVILDLQKYLKNMWICELRWRGHNMISCFNFVKNWYSATKFEKKRLSCQEKNAGDINLKYWAKCLKCLRRPDFSKIAPFRQLLSPISRTRMQYMVYVLLQSITVYVLFSMKSKVYFSMSSCILQNLKIKIKQLTSEISGI